MSAMFIRINFCAKALWSISLFMSYEKDAKNGRVLLRKSFFGPGLTVPPRMG